MRMPLAVVALCLLLGSVACSRASGTACGSTDTHSHTAADGSCICDTGFDWDADAADDDFTCVPTGAPSCPEDAACGGVQCGPDPICGVTCGTCDVPPSAFCADGDTLRRFNAGSCATGQCNFVHQDIPCGLGCDPPSGTCNGCNNTCVAGATACTGGVLERCAADATGCLAMETVSVCASGSCADVTSCAPATGVAWEMPGVDICGGTYGIEHFQFGDLNGDGRGDLLLRTTRNYPTTVYAIWLMQPDFHFQEVGTLEEGPLQIANLDGDAHADVYGISGDVVWMRTGGGDGTFSARTTLFTHEAAMILSADADLDGDTDLLAVDSWFNDTRLYLNDGTGTFTAGAGSTANARAGAHFVDVTGDGRPDLVSAENWGSGTIAVWPNTVSGFGARVDTTIDSTTMDGLGFQDANTVMGDVDNDGVGDMVARGRWHRIALFCGNGDGTFRWQSNVDSAFGIMAMGDIDGDGYADLVTNDIDAAGPSIYWGAADCSLSAPVPLITNGEHGWTGIGDLDGDGDADLVTAHSNVASVRNLGGRRFAAPGRLDIANSGSMMTRRDVDGVPGLETIITDNSLWAAATIVERKSDGTLAEQDTVLFLGAVERFIDAVDMDGDGHVDLVAGNDGEAFFAWGGPGGYTMTTSSLSDIMPYSCWGVHDVDGDQLPDVICSGWESPAILHNDGGRIFTEMNFASPLLPNEWFSATRSVDIDGDGSNEILQRLDDGTLRFLNLTLNGGTLEVDVVATLPPTGHSLFGLEFVDIDSDGLPDILGWEWSSQDTTVFVFHQGPVGTFTEVAALPNSGGAFAGLAIADFDGNGLNDVVIATSGGASGLHLWLAGSTAFSFPAAQITDISFWPYALAPEDGDGDGRVDLLVLGNGHIFTLRNIGQ